MENKLQQIKDAISKLTSAQMAELLSWSNDLHQELSAAHVQTNATVNPTDDYTDRLQANSTGNVSGYQKITARAVEVFGNEARASTWLSTPSMDLDGQVPLKIAEEDGYSLKRLEPIFTRLEYGIDF